jgi:transcriptional regulator with XRE-family HTH domain
MQKGKNQGGRPRTLAVCQLGQTIEAIARRRGMSRNDLAKATGLSAVTLHTICTGKVREPKALTLARIAAALNVSVTRLMPAVQVSRSA